MPGHDIIVIGTSAGGLDALQRLVKGFPRDLPAAVFVVQHLSPHAPSILPIVLARAGDLPAEHPADGQKFAPGHIYVAPPGAHLLLERDHIRLAAGPRENRHCPAIDPLFRTAALAYGPRVIGVVLTGALDDGTAGLLAIKQRGGIAVVQDPDEAFNASMPANALASVAVDACLPLAEIPAYLARMAREPAPPEQEYPVTPMLRAESDIDGLRPGAHLPSDRFGAPTLYTCPECKGPLREIDDGAQVRYRCMVGHAYTSEALMASQADAVDAALWMALETLEQRARVTEQMATRARQQQRINAARSFEAQADDTDLKVQALRRLLLGGGLREALIDERFAMGSEASGEGAFEANGQPDDAEETTRQEGQRH